MTDVELKIVARIKNTTEGKMDGNWRKNGLDEIKSVYISKFFILSLHSWYIIIFLNLST